jgi:hypothetical protein
MRTDTTEWEVPYHSVTSSDRTTVGLELRALLRRPLEEADKRVIDRAMRELEEDLLAEAARRDPVNIAWKEQWLSDARKLFADAGMPLIYVREIDNEYCGPRCCPHRVWLLVTTTIGVIKIGWRKNVIVIDWSATDITAQAVKLFQNENVTMGERMIHAHGYEAATRYLTTLGGRLAERQQQMEGLHRCRAEARGRYV